MKAALRLYNKKSQGLVDALLLSPDFELVCIVDADDHKWGCVEERYNIPYVSPYRLKALLDSGEVDKLIISPFSCCNVVNDVLLEMDEMGIKRDRILLPSIPDVDEIINKKVDITNCLVDEYRTITRLQYHIADHCNLNCNSCSHFSSLVPGEKFMDINELEKDLRRLRQIVKHIDMIDVLGGEPLLNKNWKDYIDLTKEIYSKSEITIITNGLLIWSLSGDDWKYMRDNDVVFRMSLYKPLWNRAEEIVELLKSKGVKYNVNYRVMSKFAYMFLNDPQGTVADNRINCSSDCFQLYHGRMTPCSRMMYIKFFNEYYGLDYPEEVAVNSIYDVEDFKTLMHQLMRPMPLCKYCNIHLKNQKFQDWSTLSETCDGKNDLSKWIV